MMGGEQPIVIENICPGLAGGRYPVKREVGDLVEVQADIFKEGHDILAARLLFREKGMSEWRDAPMSHMVNDRWRGEFLLEKNIRYEFRIEAWVDAFESWRSELEKKLAAGQDISLELLEGRAMLLDTAERASGEERFRLQKLVENIDRQDRPAERAEAILSSTVRHLMASQPDKKISASSDVILEVVADRSQARFAAWYTMSARSQGMIPGRSATLRDCEARLPEIRRMGFDVLYLLPIHPIGETHRKGPNNTPHAGPGDPGSPYAIGSAAGGHKAVHPELGTLDDFRRLVNRAGELGMEVALDFAIQCSPDHPYLREHPDWFVYRPDGSIKHAENPPKKYQDIVNVNFYGPHRDELWQEWLDVVKFWIGQGVKIFRVDNPHTKPIPFWEWLIREVQADHPEVIFLAEAFTRPKLLKALAKSGFSQSYTYFTWRNFKQELTDYLTELTQTEMKEYLRPHFFISTPDILPTYLQGGGRAAFRIRLVLAATLSSLYGVYNGFELCEADAIPGSEEYLDSEKYEYKVRDWDRPGHIKDEIATINRIRKENPALQEFENLHFYPADDDNVLFYGKSSPDGSNSIFIAVNLDPFEPHQAVLEFPLHELGIPRDKTFQAEELLTERKHLWRGTRHIVDLDPQSNPAEIFRVTRWAYRDYVETCF